MKKALMTLMFLCLAGFVMAQEENQTEFKMALGDTVVWKPFTDCNMLGYNISGPKVISFKPIKMGDQIQIVAKKVGKSNIIATCQDNDTEMVASIIVIDPNDIPVVAEKPVKPETKPFTETYKFNPPTNNYFVTINDMGTGFNETYMKHGDDEAFNDGQGIDRFWNVKTGKNWYYKPDAQGWTDDVDWEFEPFGESFPIINSFANEVNHDNLSNYYVGNETITVGSSDKPMDIECWKFFVDFEDGTVIQYWVDPANGCTLKRQINTDPAKVVTVYDLKYTRLYFGPSFKKGLHDITR
ncbi:MAG: pilus assembly protein N-terminal domain-containing protein [Bacteroidales bacterium]|nr:pilus assembly protein N-terminal domain-containing protein [Bacteroidales bacterium]